jgi:hypothetical protein
MKRCAKCDFEYDDAYDACPVCARAEALASQRIQEISAPSASGDAYGPGNLVGATLSAIALLASGAVLGGFVSGITGSAESGLYGGLLSALIWGIVVWGDASGLKRPVPQGYKINGTAGTSAGVWGIFAFLLGIVGVPMYFYHRPKIKRAYEIGAQILTSQTE